ASAVPATAAEAVRGIPSDARSMSRSCSSDGALKRTASASPRYHRSVRVKKSFTNNSREIRKLTCQTGRIWQIGIIGEFGRLPNLPRPGGELCHAPVRFNAQPIQPPYSGLGTAVSVRPLLLSWKGECAFRF